MLRHEHPSRARRAYRWGSRVCHIIRAVDSSRRDSLATRSKARRHSFSRHDTVTRNFTTDGTRVAAFMHTRHFAVAWPEFRRAMGRLLDDYQQSRQPLASDVMMRASQLAQSASFSRATMACRARGADGVEFSQALFAMNDFRHATTQNGR